jgi:three-Cys-motif partner protein
MAAFFDDKKEAARLKHEILRRYLPRFIMMPGSTSQGGKVVYIDGFAGRGRYRSGETGSPMIAAELARDLAASNRDVSCIYVERRPRYCDSLRSELSAIKHRHEVVCGSAAEIIPGLVRNVPSSVPLLVFLDPFGMGPMPFDFLQTVLRRGRLPGTETTAPTELIIRFTLAPMHRVGAFLNKPENERGKFTTSLKTLDAAIGGEWWHEYRKGAWTPARQHDFALEYTHRLRATAGAGAGWEVLGAAIAPRPNGPPAYFLVFFTKSPHGVWEFWDSVSKTREEQFKRQPQRGLYSFEEPIVQGLKTNLRSLLVEKPECGVMANYREVFGSQVGKGRETHLRSALKELKAEGVVAEVPKGKLKLATIRRA